MFFWVQGDPEEVEEGEEVDADDGRAKQRSVFAWQAVNLVNGPPVTRDGEPAAPTACCCTASLTLLQYFVLCCSASLLCCVIHQYLRCCGPASIAASFS